MSSLRVLVSYIHDLNCLQYSVFLIVVPVSLVAKEIDFFFTIQENVSSSGDLTAKTKSVIELKKLQLLPLQRRVRRFVRQWR